MFHIIMASIFNVGLTVSGCLVLYSTVLYSAVTTSSQTSSLLFLSFIILILILLLLLLHLCKVFAWLFVCIVRLFIVFLSLFGFNRDVGKFPVWSSLKSFRTP